MTNKLHIFFLVSVSAYIFFAPIFSGFDIFLFKKLAIISMLLSLFSLILIDLSQKIDYLNLFLIILIPSLIFYDLIIWNNYQEVNLIFTILIGYYVAKNIDRFKYILLLVLIIQFCLISYEFIVKDYIYTQVAMGFSSGDISFIKSESYGSVGFRPKGLFFGVLEATSFAIILSFIFRKNIYILSILMLMGIMLNGRLALLIISLIFIISLYLTIFKLHISSYSKILLSYSPIILMIIGLIGFIFLHSSDAINNFLEISNTKSDSNSARITYTIQGIQEFLNYDFIYVLFGNSNYFYETYNHSAESGWVNQLLNIGLIGTSIYIFFITYLCIKSFKNNEIFMAFTFVLIFLAISIYRFEAGYLRGILLWFYIFTSLNYLNMKENRLK